ncbi:helix-turn-helix domain-containing protein [Streptomyces monashensis]|uniref:HTH iclR-type domain-containing protein n=1 Tax=Streptomyces monashensis TaxID=1678012 RepID=A0A1S2NYS3_9ACTN|nr:helix-turn-helix domain-containing protein [Streptomyces monashensis]OIJ86627.1 hypothetical protein BIV23_43820 [Streptomyces monashensis]
MRRPLNILDLPSEDRPAITLQEITEATGPARTTAPPLVQTLEKSGLPSVQSADRTARRGLWR